MTQVNCIRELFFEKGLSYAAISRRTGVDVKTVKKYICQEDFNMPEPRPQPRRVSKLDPFKKDIDTWLQEDKNAKKKQRHTACRVFDRLGEKYAREFSCSYRLVAGYVAKKKREIYGGEHEFYLPLQHIPGEAQVDFGEADFYENGHKHSGHFLNISFPFSNAGYLQLFKSENQQCLMEGLKDIFEKIGGVPTRIWFDNPGTIVTKVHKDGERTLTDTFSRFMNHYRFTAAFCNVASAHEKGSVETKVGYHRRNLLVPVPEVRDLRQFNRGLLDLCNKDMQRLHYTKPRLIGELFEEDLDNLLPLPDVPFDCSDLVTVRTDSSARFTLSKGKHTYSTAPTYAKTNLHVKLTAHEIIVLDENYREVKRHPRLYGDNNQQSMDWLPYLTQLSRRPAALKYSGVYELFPKEVKVFLDSLSIPGKKEILTALARLSKEAEFSRVIEALKVAVEHGVEDGDSIIATFSRLNSQVLDLKPLALPSSVPFMPPLSLRMSDYNQFLQGGQGQ